MAVTHAPYIEGNLQDWVGAKYPTPFRGRPGEASEWRENLPFYAQLTYVGYSRGRSSVNFTWVDGNGSTYPMFLTDLDSILVDGQVSYADTGFPVAVLGNWIVTKRGQSYGIKKVIE